MQSIYNQLIYFAFFQCVLLLMVYVFSSKRRKLVNNYLIVLIIAILLGLIGKTLHIQGYFGQDFRLIAFSELAGLLFGTTIYLFTRTSFLGKNYKTADLVHYIPALSYTVFVVFYFMLPSNLAMKDRMLSGESDRIIYLFHAMGLIVNTTYWFISFRGLLLFRKKLKNELSYSVKDSFFYNLHIVVGICLFVWSIIYVISLFGPIMIERDFRTVVWLIMSFIVLFIAYYSMISPDIYKRKPLNIVKKYNQSKYSNDDLDRLKTQLDAVMQDKKPYLNNKLLKAELSEMIGISNPEMARLLNERIGMNFFEYVNYYRIKEFIEVAKVKKDDLTLFGIAQEVGFNSKATFIKSFKNLMGTTPSQYFNN
ncbi:helix-turn-helix domain-containing protein [Aureibaculum sp. 2210JD6-5]|uniref:helix-turn-helix domain-containing protein n=1 Tax=Aureibaculum sp. 2210JD6-5 TaxID=3103957 RepID=UPI002AACFF50|nr:helix-turn-helix domain-containing protein [Aureibaculum sp. 2210JD6-5]MDY7396992.1 helix-turn-helix domain-containing protein [Aureibaculum sp. 2210JD6-5]